MYQKDVLREYIKKSELRLFSNKIKVRLSKGLALKYDQGHYQNYLKNIQKCFDMINTLNIQYPGNAKPILYVYIVPDENYAKLLKIPNYYNTGNSGGKPVTCYDLDGFMLLMALVRIWQKIRYLKLLIFRNSKMSYMNFRILFIVSFFQLTQQFVRDLLKHYLYML